MPPLPDDPSPSDKTRLRPICILAAHVPLMLVSGLAFAAVAPTDFIELRAYSFPSLTSFPGFWIVAGVASTASVFLSPLSDQSARLGKPLVRLQNFAAL